jgi:hypothetical protein
MATGALGMRDPTSPGTTTEASAAMRAARATTLGSRTSGRTVPQDGVAWALRGIRPDIAARLQIADGPLHGA